MLTFLDRLLITFFDYTPWTEVHGFEHNAFDRYIGHSPSDNTPVMVGRGGIFGGSRAYLEVASTLRVCFSLPCNVYLSGVILGSLCNSDALLDIIRHETLVAGFMGTEENLFRYHRNMRSCVGAYFHPRVCAC
jgi:hypothetical protein